MTIDNAMKTVKYGDRELTADSGSVNSWTSVKVFSFTDAGPMAKLEIYGSEFSNCDGCACAGLSVHCASDDSTAPWHNFVSDTTHWKSRVENSNRGNTEYATPCVSSSSSGFSLRGFSHISRCDVEGADGKYCKIWAAGTWATGAWTDKYMRFNGSPYEDTEEHLYHPDRRCLSSGMLWCEILGLPRRVRLRRYGPRESFHEVYRIMS
jgi:hypothetical protein